MMKRKTISILMAVLMLCYAPVSISAQDATQQVVIDYEWNLLGTHASGFTFTASEVTEDSVFMAITAPTGTDMLMQHIPETDDWSVHIGKTFSTVNNTKHWYEYTMTYVDGKLYYIGGYTSGGIKYDYEMSSYDYRTRAWETFDFPIKELTRHSSVAVEKEIYVIGKNLFLIYDTETNTWTEQNRPPETIGDTTVHNTVYVDGKIYVFGGFDESASLFHVYDIERDEWSVGSMPTPKVYGGNAVLADNKIYVFGSNNYVSNRILDIYDIETQQWQTSQVIPELAALERNSNHYHAISYFDGKFYITSSMYTYVMAINEITPVY